MDKYLVSQLYADIELLRDEVYGTDIDSSEISARLTSILDIVDNYEIVEEKHIKKEVSFGKYIQKLYRFLFRKNEN